MTDESTDEARSRRGRPRDPDLEDRVYDAVLEVYWEKGWSGFTLDAVARRASVGRAALYRRWESKGALVVDALEARSPLATPIDLGNLRADLVELAVQLLQGYRGTAGLVSLRVALDARVHPDLLGRMMETLNKSRLVAARLIVHRAQKRGELSESADTTRILELVTGAVLSHVIFSHRIDGADRGDTEDRVYAESLVDAVLGGV
ncbi:TetR/AcrR family transcriptional regulator [Rhodococcus sp. 1R11]|uniref:TetR/AcrR family transcriptional regulator n=1 Tax=Rhodococcus sp. 1R11 TaxID=2559614 RepID=UPI001FD68278|nr:TetR/AcrR family transcriptional regulator [Rhodococcus sp. 1R11]